MSEKYHFSDPAEQQKAWYVLVMYFKNQHVAPPRTQRIAKSGDYRKKFFGYYDKPDHGLNQLRGLVTAYQGRFTAAVIYGKKITNSTKFDVEVEKYH